MSFLLDILTFGSFRSQPRKSPDDLFIDTMRQHGDIWRECFSNHNNVLCCPASTSLADISREHLLSHVLIPDVRSPGSYVTLRGESVVMNGLELHCTGFPDQRRVRILNTSPYTDPATNRTTTIYYLSRPLVGGVIAPEGVDEISQQAMFRYVAVLRSFPEVEGAFNVLDDFIKEVNFVGEQSTDGFSRVSPSLAVSLHAQWVRTVERLIRSGSLSYTLDSNSDTLKSQIGQIIESYIMSGVFRTVYPWLQREHRHASHSLWRTIVFMRPATMSDLSIRAEFQCSLWEASQHLRLIGQAFTPVDKLLVLKRTVTIIRECVDKNVRRNFPQSDIELSTDDLVLLLIFVIIQTSLAYHDLPTDLRFITDFHFVSSSRSQLGFTLCHFQVAMTWFLSRVDLVDAELGHSSGGLRSTSSGGSLGSPSLSPRSGGGGRVVGTRLDLGAGLDAASSELTESDSDRERDRDRDRERFGDKDTAGQAAGDCLSVSSMSSNSPPGSPARKPSLRNRSRLDHLSSSLDSLEAPDANVNANASPSTGNVKAKINTEFEGIEAITLPPFSLDDNAWSNRLWLERETKTSTDTSATCDASSAGPGTRIRVLGSDSGGYAGTHLFADLDPRAHATAANSAGYRVPVGGFGRVPYSEHAILSERTNRAGPVLAVQSSEGYYAAINIDGGVYTWGAPACGRLGRGAADELDAWAATSQPTLVPLGPALALAMIQGQGQGEGARARELACGLGHMLCLTDRGEVFAWGDNRCAQLGLAAPSSSVGVGAGTGSANSSASNSASNLSGSAGNSSNGSGGEAVYQTPEKARSRSFSANANANAIANTNGRASPVSPLGSPLNYSVGLSSSGGPNANPNTHTHANSNANSNASSLNAVAIAYRTSDLATVMASAPIQLELPRVLAIACGAYHSLCLVSDSASVGVGAATSTSASGGSSVRGGVASSGGDTNASANTNTGYSLYTWGRVAGGRLGQFRDKLDIPDNAVGRPGLVRCSWRVRRYGISGEGLSGAVSAVGAVNAANGTSATTAPSPANTNTNTNTSASPNSIAPLQLPPPSPVFSPSPTSPFTPYTFAGNLNTHTNANTISNATTIASPLYALPPQPRSPARLVAIACGHAHSVAITQCGCVFTWGAGLHGRLGHGGHSDEFAPKQVAALAVPGLRIASASAGHAHTAFLTAEGLLFACGLNNKNQAACLPVVRGAHDANANANANGATTNTSAGSGGGHRIDRVSVLVPRPVPIPQPITSTSTSTTTDTTSAGDEEVKSGDTDAAAGMTNFLSARLQSVACGNHHTAAITRDGRLLVWGAHSLPVDVGANASPYRILDATALLSSPPATIAANSSSNAASGATVRPKQLSCGAATVIVTI